MKNQSLLYLFATQLLLSSCLSTGTEKKNNLDFDISVHKEQQKQFQDSRPESYSYIYYSSGFLLYHFRAFVSGDSVDSLVDLSEQRSGDSLWGPNIQHYHIDSVFKEISDTYTRNNGIETEGKDYYITEILCSYDSEWHFPTRYSYSYYSAPYIEVDGNFGASISDFRVEE